MPKNQANELDRDEPRSAPGRVEHLFNTRTKALAAAVGLSLLHFGLLMHFYAPAISTPDAQGYFAQARLIATTGHTGLVPESPIQYIGPHWHTPDGVRYFTTFPPGLPTLLAATRLLLGVRAMFLVNPLLASFSLLLLFLLARKWLSTGWALFAALLFALNPAFDEHALFGDSHVAVVFLTLSGLLLLNNATRERSTGLAALAGVALGLLPTVRYAEATVPVLAGLYLLWQARTGKVTSKTLIWFTLGAAIPVALLAARNWTAFGAPWRTGYHLPGQGPQFGLEYLAEHLIPFFLTLAADGLGPLILFAFAGFAVLIRRHNSRADGLFLLALSGTALIVYASYAWPVDRQSTRFVLYTFPLYILAAVYLLAATRGRLRAVLVAVLLVLAIPWSVGTTLRKLERLHFRNGAVAKVTEGIQREVPPGSVLITYEGICQNLDVYGQWKLVDIWWVRHPQLGRLPGPGAGRRLRNVKAAKTYRSLPPAEWAQRFAGDLQDWAQGAPIYVVAYQRDLIACKQALVTSFDLREKTKIPLCDLVHRGRPGPPPGPGTPWTAGPLPGRSEPLHWGPNQIFDFLVTGRELVVTELVPKGRAFSLPVQKGLP